MLMMNILYVLETPLKRGHTLIWESHMSLRVHLPHFQQQIVFACQKGIYLVAGVTVAILESRAKAKPRYE